MAQKSSEEIEDSLEERKIRIRQFNKFLKFYFNWIIIGIVAVIFISGFFFLLLPKYRQTAGYIKASNQQQALDTSAKREELKKIQQLLAAYDGIDKKYIDKINAIAPVIKNKEELFSELNYLVSVNQLVLQTITLSQKDGYEDQGLVPISPAQGKIPTNIETVNIILTIRGINYESFKGFLTALENNLRLMDVLTVSYAPSSESTSLSINTYYSKK
jgi:hypothetical protein